MFLRAHEIESGSVFEHDLVIIGSGAAGISIAREFLDNSRLSIAVLEAGGLSFSAHGQEYYRGETSGTVLHSKHTYLEHTRLRYFGGTTNHWHGWCGRLDPIDFEKRSWIPHSGWPIGRKDLEPYYTRALPVVELDDIDTPLQDLAQTERPLLLADSTKVKTRIFHRSPPTRFGKKYRPELEGAGHIHVYLASTVAELICSRSGNAIVEAVVRRGDRRWSIRGKQFVLAAGGIENPRLLLASNSTFPQGLGNEHDLVGRYFMDHIQVTDIGEVILSNNKLSAHLYERFVHPACNHMIVGTSTLVDEEQRQQKLPNSSIFYMNASRPTTSIAKAVQRVAYQIDTHQSLNERLTHFGRLECRSEQIPNPESRVTITRERDALQMPIVKLDWQLSNQDRAGVSRTLKVLASEFGAHAEGRLRVAIRDGLPWNPQKTFGGAHHIGTTRMHENPKKGVVNADCRIHSISNLYLAGSSVFPTSGAMNPTLTIVALSLRLADHLKGVLAR